MTESVCEPPPVCCFCVEFILNNYRKKMNYKDNFLSVCFKRFLSHLKVLF